MYFHFFIWNNEHGHILFATVLDSRSRFLLVNNVKAQLNNDNSCHHGSTDNVQTAVLVLWIENDIHNLHMILPFLDYEEDDEKPRKEQEETAGMATCLVMSSNATTSL